MSTPSDDAALGQARARIDRIDQRIQALISERARVVVALAEIKQAAGRADFYRPEREAQVLARVAAHNAGPLADGAVARVMREIMSVCLALQKPMTVAYLGPEGTYTQAAAYKHFGHAITVKPNLTIGDIFRAVEAGNARFGVVPVENSTEGGVGDTLDQLAGSRLSICGEVALAVHHHLLSHAARLSDVTRVIAHAQSLAQCRRWLDTHLPGVARETVASNGKALQRAADEPNAAAIADREAGERYQLSILDSNIEDEPRNTTRFLILGAQSVAASGRDITSILVAIDNAPGRLYRLLAPAAEAGVDLVRIQSRPSMRRVWDYNFFIDIEGHVDDGPVRQTIEAIAAEAVTFKILGSYPRYVARDGD